MRAPRFLTWIILARLLGPALAAAAPEPAALVDMNAESGEGILFRGATVPFGMVMFGPNLKDGNFGYSLTCLSGAEMSEDYYRFVAIRPASGPVRAQLAQPEPLARHNAGRPGSFATTLADGTGVELTASARTGMGRFSFAPGRDGSLLLSADAAAFEPGGNRITGSQTLAGVTVHFAAEADRPWQACGTWNKSWLGTSVRTGAAPARHIAGAWLTFAAGPPVLLKVGMSYVDRDGALANLRGENPGWDFDGLRAAAAARWAAALARIQVQGGAPGRAGLFYTCLYRCFLQPNLFSDLDGRYRGFDAAVHRAEGYQHYANYSIWDTYRTWTALVAWLDPATASDMIQSLVVDAREGGGAMPRWPVAACETGTMEEGSATPLVATGYAFGARHFDLEAAFAAMELAEGHPGARCQDTEAHPSLADYLELGFVPQGWNSNTRRSASFTLEYAQADFALSRFAAALGKGDAASRYLALSGNWKHLWNPATGYLQARHRDGAFYPRTLDPAKGHFRGFTEGNAAQFTWTVRHDMAGLIALVGKDAALRRLDELCAEVNAGPDRARLWIGNEPGFTVPYAYLWAGAPDRTQALVRRILDQAWQPGTTPGADDLGALSAWYVWSCLGLFPAIPGEAGWALTSPAFPAIRVALPGGRSLDIGAGPGASPYIAGVTLDGAAQTSTWLPLSALDRDHSDLRFTLQAAPSAWGAGQPPPSFSAKGRDAN